MEAVKFSVQLLKSDDCVTLMGHGEVSKEELIEEAIRQGEIDSDDRERFEKAEFCANKWMKAVPREGIQPTTTSHVKAFAGHSKQPVCNMCGETTMTKSTITREQAQKIIVAADEVITALAGTNEDVHPDDSKKMCELWDDLNDRYAPPVVVRELAHMALAAMDREHVRNEHASGHRQLSAMLARLAH